MTGGKEGMEILRCEGIKKVYGTGNNRVAGLQDLENPHCCTFLVL